MGTMQTLTKVNVGIEDDGASRIGTIVGTTIIVIPKVHATQVLQDMATVLIELSSVAWDGMKGLGPRMLHGSSILPQSTTTPSTIEGFVLQGLKVTIGQPDQLAPSGGRTRHHTTPSITL